MVDQITSMDVDFGQWYTDVVKKAELADYSGVKGCMIFRPYGYGHTRSYDAPDNVPHNNADNGSISSRRSVC